MHKLLSLLLLSLFALFPLAHSATVSYIQGSCVNACNWTDAIWTPSVPAAGDTVTINSTTPITIFAHNVVITLSYLSTVNSMVALDVYQSYFTLSGSMYCTNLTALNSSFSTQSFSGGFVSLTSSLINGNHTTATNLTLNNSDVEAPSGFNLQLSTVNMNGDSSILVKDSVTVDYLTSTGPTTFPPAIYVNFRASFNNNNNLTFAHVLAVSGSVVKFADCNTVISTLSPGHNSTYIFTTSTPGSYSAFVNQWGNPAYPPANDTLILGNNMLITFNASGTVSNLFAGDNVQFNSFGVYWGSFYLSNIVQAPGDFFRINATNMLTFLSFGDISLNAEIFAQVNSTITVSTNVTLTSTNGGPVVTGPGSLSLVRSLYSPGMLINVSQVTTTFGNLTVGTLSTSILSVIYTAPAGFIPNHTITGNVVVTNMFSTTGASLFVDGNYTQNTGSINITLSQTPTTPYLQVTGQVNILGVAVSAIGGETVNIADAKWLLIRSPNPAVASNSSHVFISSFTAEVYQPVIVVEGGDVYLVVHENKPDDHKPSGLLIIYIIAGVVGGIVVVGIIACVVIRSRRHHGYKHVDK